MKTVKGNNAVKPSGKALSLHCLFREMSQENQGTDHTAPANPPVKRKRGRPRKDENPIHREKASITPGSDAGKRNIHQKMDQSDDTSNVMVGQVVSGVLEGSFDAGYLLTVKVGGTDTVLRGVVFEPGFSIPISVANDVAPHMKMLKRNEIPLPVVDQPTRAHGSSSQFEQRNAQPAMLLQRNSGTLPPTKVHGSTSQSEQKDIQLAKLLQRNEGAPQVLHSQLEVDTIVVSKEEVNNTDNVAHAVTQTLQQAQTKTNSASQLAGRLPSDAGQGVQVSLPAAESQIKDRKSTNTLPQDDTQHASEGQLGDTSQAPVVTPQQPVQSEPKKEPASATQPLPVEHNGIVELAEVLQENEVSVPTDGSPGGVPKDWKLEPITEPFIKTLQGSETIDLIAQAQHQDLAFELNSGQMSDNALKSKEIEVDHTPVADAPQPMATELINEPMKMSQGFQASLNSDRQQDTQSVLSVEIPRGVKTAQASERLLTDAVEMTEVDSESEPRTNNW